MGQSLWRKDARDWNAGDTAGPRIGAELSSCLGDRPPCERWTFPGDTSDDSGFGVLMFIGKVKLTLIDNRLDVTFSWT